MSSLVVATLEQIEKLVVGFVKIGPNMDLTFERTKNYFRARRKCDKAGHWMPGAANDDLFACRCPIEQSGKVRFCVVHVYNHVRMLVQSD